MEVVFDPDRQRQLDEAQARMKVSKIVSMLYAYMRSHDSLCVDRQGMSERDKVITELIDTERTYLNDLKQARSLLALVFIVIRSLANIAIVCLTV